MVMRFANGWERIIERKEAMEILEKVAYIKGMAEGLDLDTKSKEGRLLTLIIDVLEDMALEMQDIRDEQQDLEEGLDAVSDDLSDVESCLYELDEEDDEEDDDGKDHYNLFCLGDEEDEEEEGDDDEDEDEENTYESICPSCGEPIYFDEDVLMEGSINCPHCGQSLVFDLDRQNGCCGGCQNNEGQKPCHTSDTPPF